MINDGRILYVPDFQEFSDAEFNPAHVILLPRTLGEDFKSLARWFDHEYQIEEKGIEWKFGLQGLDRLSPHIPSEEKAAFNRIAGDLDRFQKLAESRNNHRSIGFISVMSSQGYQMFDHCMANFHHDTHVMPRNPTGRILSCYTPPVTEWVLYEDAILKGQDQYRQKPGGQVNRFGLGDVWRQAGINAALKNTPPFIHRSQKQNAGDPPRMILMVE